MSPSLSKRLLGGLYEGLLVAGLLLLTGFLLVPLGQGLALTPQETQWFTRTWIAVVVSVYFVWFWTHGGQTLPMKTWRIRLQMQDGRPISWPFALFRLLLLVAGFGLVGIHILWALFDPDKQFLHDRLLGTRLVEAETRQGLGPRFHPSP